MRPSPVQPLTPVNAQSKENVGWLIEKLMVKNRERRYGSWPEVLDDIRRVTEGKMPRAPLPELGEAAGWGSESPEAEVLRAERRARLARALDALAPEDREVLVLRDLEELTGEETAAALGLSLAAMKSRLHRARLRLAAQLRRNGPC